MTSSPTTSQVLHTAHTKPKHAMHACTTVFGPQDYPCNPRTHLTHPATEACQAHGHAPAPIRRQCREGAWSCGGPHVLNRKKYRRSGRGNTQRQQPQQRCSSAATAKRTPQLWKCGAEATTLLCSNTALTRHQRCLVTAPISHYLHQAFACSCLARRQLGGSYAAARRQMLGC